MVRESREFQIFAKPAGARCNLGCHYCYYLDKEPLSADGASLQMPDHLLETYIIQHINASTEPIITFSWHGGEPTILGLDYFQKIVELQHKHQPLNRRIVNGMQTNGTLLDEAWCRFLATEGFFVGISLDGPAELHDIFRVSKNQKSTHSLTMRGYELLQRFGVSCEILCVVNADNVQHPLRIYEYFKGLNARYVTFLPLVERITAAGHVSSRTAPALAYGEFLCTIFDEWVTRDISRMKVQIFEEAARSAFGQDHTLCIFKETCGGVPVVECNGDFYACDHYVDDRHRLGNIRDTSLADLLDSPAQKEFGRAKRDTLPQECRRCEFISQCNGGCPKDRFLLTANGEPGLNYLCAGYKLFFSHCRPFIAEVAAQWRLHNLSKREHIATQEQAPLKIGRNEPCPCGSGLKYKNCCLHRS